MPYIKLVIKKYSAELNASNMTVGNTYALRHNRETMVKNRTGFSFHEESFTLIDDNDIQYKMSLTEVHAGIKFGYWEEAPNPLNEGWTQVGLGFYSE